MPIDEHGEKLQRLQRVHEVLLEKKMFHIETFSKQVKPREKEDFLRLEYRSKLLNLRWAEACLVNS